MSKPDGERIAHLETKEATHDVAIEKLTTAVMGISEQLHEITVELAKSRGFVAGISFAFSMLGAMIAFGLDYLLRGRP